MKRHEEWNPRNGALAVYVVRRLYLLIFTVGCSTQCWETVVWKGVIVVKKSCFVRERIEGVVGFLDGAMAGMMTATGHVIWL